MQKIMDFKDWIDASPAIVLVGTSTVAGLGGILAWMKAHNSQWPPASVAFTSFGMSFLTAAGIYLWARPDWQGDPGKLIAICILSGLTGSSGLGILMDLITGKTKIQISKKGK